MVKKRQGKTRNKQTKSSAKKKKRAQHYGFKKNTPSVFYHKAIADAWDQDKTLQQNYAAMGLVMDVNTHVNDKLTRVLTRQLHAGRLSAAAAAAGAAAGIDADGNAENGGADDMSDAKSGDSKTKAKAKGKGKAAASASASASASGSGSGSGATIRFAKMPTELSDLAFDASDSDDGDDEDDDGEGEGEGHDEAVSANGDGQPTRRLSEKEKVAKQKKRVAAELRAVQKASANPLPAYVAKTMPVHEQQTLLQLKRKYGDNFSAMARDMTINVHQRTEGQLRKKMAQYDALLAL